MTTATTAQSAFTTNSSYQTSCKPGDQFFDHSRLWAYEMGDFAPHRVESSLSPHTCGLCAEKNGAERAKLMNTPFLLFESWRKV
jgi:hypothetical protein